MKKINSISGGQTSAYIAANYPADFDLFALITTTDLDCLYPDKLLRKYVSDKIGREFIGTLEDDVIIKTIIELEQYTGREITWVCGKPFDEIINRNGKTYLPNVTQRFCTTEMKLRPLFDWWQKNINEIVEMRIGFRFNEQRRAKSMLNKCNSDGVLSFKTIVGKQKGNIRPNAWGWIPWQKPVFPLIDARLYKENIIKYWQDKPVTFAYMNNCIGCFHRNEVLLKHMSERHPNKYNWFVKQEVKSKYDNRTFKNGISYEQIKNSLKQMSLFDDDFNSCDSGYCGFH